jgi:hypothetical protein
MGAAEKITNCQLGVFLAYAAMLARAWLVSFPVCRGIREVRYKESSL